ncbi:MAG: hypothetical protein ACR2NG_03945 [Acidimicrobiia bacterium]
MKPSYGSALSIGAIVGTVIALSAMVFVAATGGVAKLTVIGDGTSIEPAFAVPASAFFMVATLVGGVCGLVLAVGTRAIAAVIDPETSGAPTWLIGTLGFVVGAVVSAAVFPLGVTLVGTVQDGLATASVVDIVLLTIVAGLAGGAVICWQSYIMARPPQPKPDTELLAA